MAGPSIVVRVLADIKGFAGSLKGVAEEGKGAAAGMHEAFSGMLNTLNKTGVLGPFGESLATINDSLESISKKGKGISDMLLGVGAAVTGVGVGLSALGSKDKSSQQQLKAAIAATGSSYSTYGDEVEKAVKHNENFGQSASSTQDALRVLTQATGSPAKALELLGTATDLAAAKHQNLFDAATDLGKVYNGNTRLLKEYGITVTKSANTQKLADTASKAAAASDKALATAKQRLTILEATDATKKHLTTVESLRLKAAQQAVTDAANKARVAHANLAAAQENAKKKTDDHKTAVDELGAKLKGQAAASVDSFSGKLKVMTTKVEDQAAAFGQKYGPAITAAGAVTTTAGGVIKTTSGIMDSFSKASKTAESATKDVAAAEEGAQAASSLLAGASGIGLVVLAILALIAIGYVIYRNWSTIWNGIKALFEMVWNWLKANWPLLLGVLTGPFGLAVALIYKYWDQIWSLLTSIAGKVAHIAGTFWHWISDAFNTTVSAITRAWASVWAWFSGLPRAIANAAAGMWHGITDAFGTVLGGLKLAWGAVTGWLAGLPTDIANGVSGMWDGIWNAFKGVIDKIIGLWNEFAGLTAIHVHIPIPFTKGINFDHGPVIPSIPMLAAGGLMTSDGLVYAHAGEVISPAPRGAGPAVVINDAHFGEAIDVDLFMARVAWSVRTARV